jgi:hypothetical protein
MGSLFSAPTKHERETRGKPAALFAAKIERSGSESIWLSSRGHTKRGVTRSITSLIEHHVIIPNQILHKSGFGNSNFWLSIPQRPPSQTSTVATATTTQRLPSEWHNTLRRGRRLRQMCGRRQIGRCRGSETRKIIRQRFSAICSRSRASPKAKQTGRRKVQCFVIALDSSVSVRFQST